MYFLNIYTSIWHVHLKAERDLHVLVHEIITIHDEHISSLNQLYWKLYKIVTIAELGEMNFISSPTKVIFKQDWYPSQLVYRELLYQIVNVNIDEQIKF